MTSRPRRIPPTPQQRTNRILTQTRGAHSAQGAVPAARPVPVVKRSRTFQTQGPITVGDTTGQTESIAITTSTGAASGSIATGFRATAYGWDAEAPGGNATALGAQTFASGGSAVAVGSSASAETTSALAIGCGARAAATPSVAIGTLDSGSGVHAMAAGTVAIGADSSLVGAVALNADEFVLGTANHIVIVNGKLVAGDGSGGLWQIVVSTGGALSTVAYP